MINVKHITVISSQDKALPIPVSCLKVVNLQSLKKVDSSDVYFCLSSFCGSPAMKSSMLRCHDNPNLTLPLSKVQQFSNRFLDIGFRI